MGKEFTCNAGNTRNVDLVSESGKFPEEGHGNHCNILAWRIPWTEEPGGLQSIGSQKIGYN